MPTIGPSRPTGKPAARAYYYYYYYHYYYYYYFYYYYFYYYYYYQDHAQDAHDQRAKLEDAAYLVAIEEALRLRETRINIITIFYYDHYYHYYHHYD